MRPVLVHRRPPRQLARLGQPAAGVLASGAIGYLDAAEDDRRRWIAGFRSLLDGLEAPLQVIIDLVPGTRTDLPDSPAAAEAAPPPPAGRRTLDLAFAQAVRGSASAQRRVVRFATPLAALGGLERALRGMGAPEVRPLDWQPVPGTLFGVETPGALRDVHGWHRSWWLDRFPGGDLTPGWLLRLAPPGLRITLAWHAERLPTAWAVEFLQRQLVHMRATQMHQADGVGDPHVEGAAPAAQSLQRRLAASEESAFHVALYLTLTAGSAEELEAGSALVEAAARSALCRFLPATFRHVDARLATLPAARDPLGRCHVLDTSSLATF